MIRAIRSFEVNVALKSRNRKQNFLNREELIKVSTMKINKNIITPLSRGLFCLVVTATITGCTGAKDTPEVTFERGRLLADRGEFEDAIPLYDKALMGTPDRAVIYYERGRAYEELGMVRKELLNKAIEDYTVCLDKDPDFLQALNNMGVTLAKMERYEEAALEFGELIAVQPDDVLALRNRGLCYHDNGELDKALSDYNTALNIDPDNTPTLFQRGNVFLERKDYESAIADFDKAIAVDPQYAKAWMNRGVARYGLNQRAAALKDLEQAQALDDSIILPGIDWATVGKSEEVTAARPTYPEQAVGGDWTEVLSMVQETLTQNDFTNLKLVSSVSELSCGRFTAMNGEGAVVVYFGMLHPETSMVSIPAGSKETSEPSRALLVLARSADGEEFVVQRFVRNWVPVPADVAPKVIDVVVPAA